MSDLEKSGHKYLMEEIRFCPCGNLADTFEVLLEFLRAHDDSYPGATDRMQAIVRNLSQRENIGLLVLQFMDRMGLVEHGGNILHSWLTPEGSAVKAFLERYGVDPQSWPSYPWE